MMTTFIAREAYRRAIDVTWKVAARSRRGWIEEVCPEAGGWREPPALGRARRKVVFVPDPRFPRRQG